MAQPSIPRPRQAGGDPQRPSRQRRYPRAGARGAAAAGHAWETPPYPIAGPTANRSQQRWVPMENSFPAQPACCSALLGKIQRLLPALRRMWAFPELQNELFFFFLAFKKHGENIKIVFWLFCQTAFGSSVSRRSGARSRLPSVGAARRWQVAAVGAGSARGMGLQGAAVPRAVLCHSGFCGVPRTAAEPIRLRAPFPGGWQHGLGGFLFSCTELPEHGAAQSPGDATSTWARRWAAPASLAGAPTVAVGRVEAEPVQAGLPCRNPAVEAALQSINQ